MNIKGKVKISQKRPNFVYQENMKWLKNINIYQIEYYNSAYSLVNTYVTPR